MSWWSIIHSRDQFFLDIFSYLLGWIELLYHSHSLSTRVYRPKLIHVLRHLRPSSLDPSPPDILVTMAIPNYTLTLNKRRVSKTQSTNTSTSGSNCKADWTRGCTNRSRWSPFPTTNSIDGCTRRFWTANGSAYLASARTQAGGSAARNASFRWSSCSVSSRAAAPAICCLLEIRTHRGGERGGGGEGQADRRHRSVNFGSLQWWPWRNATRKQICRRLSRFVHTGPSSNWDWAGL
jgi:hypothetical protein